MLLALRGIDIFNSIIAGHKVEASKALLEMALDKDHDPAECRKCATAIMRAPFQRYPSAVAINGPTPPKSKRRKNDDDDPDNNGDGDDGGDDQPPTPPEDLMRAYDHGYWNGYATRHWPRATVETVEEATANFASHAPGRQEPFQSDNLPELPYTHRHPQASRASRATDRRFPRRSVRTGAAILGCLRPSVRADSAVPSIAAAAIDASRCRGLPVLRHVPPIVGSPDDRCELVPRSLAASGRRCERIPPCHRSPPRRSMRAGAVVCRSSGTCHRSPVPPAIGASTPPVARPRDDPWCANARCRKSVVRLRGVEPPRRR